MTDDHAPPDDRRSPRVPSTHRRSTARAKPRCARSTASTSSSSRAQFTAIMGPSGSGKSTLLHCLAGLDRAHVGPGVPRRRRAQRAQREAAHASPPRPHRLRVPGVQPDPDAHRAREHHAADGARRPQARPGVARPRRRHRPARATGSTHRPSRALRRSAAARRGRARARRAGPRSSSPTSPPATSTRAPSAEILDVHARGGRRPRPDDRDGHARPDRRGYADRVVFLADGASSTSCATRPPTPSSTRCAGSAT